MLDVPSAELWDDSICLIWLARHLHPDGFTGPHCHRPERRLFRQQGGFPAYRCRACDGDSTLLTNTVFEKTRQRPATPVLLLRGMANGEPTARLARELGLSRKPLHTVRQRVQAPLHHSAPAEVMAGATSEADALDQNAGEKKPPAS